MEETLRMLGLNEQEIKVYVACIKLGSSKASEIALKADIERKASYYTLELLFNKGLITTSIKSGVRFFSPTNPELILAKIEEEEKIKKLAAKELIGKLKELRNVALPKPEVEQYEGSEGFKTILRELTEKAGVVNGYVTEKIATFLPIFAMQFRRLRKENKVFLKAISEKNESMEKFSKTDNKELRELRFNNKLLEGKDYSLYITEDKVIFVRATEKEQIGIKISDPSFAQLQRDIFNELWKSAKK